jgi:hypothetical protein
MLALSVDSLSITVDEQGGRFHYARGPLKVKYIRSHHTLVSIFHRSYSEIYGKGGRY